MTQFFRSRWVSPPAGTEELDPTKLAPGFRAAGVSCGIKPSGAPDLGLVVCDAMKVSSAAVFTKNAAAAAPVRVCRDACDLDSLRAVVANSGNANAATGEAGLEDARSMQGEAADVLGIPPERVGVASTGVIGVPLPMDAVRTGITGAADEISLEGGSAFAQAILTTDNGPKQGTVRSEGVTVSAQAKGAGMMEPNFATLLAFVQTDAVVPNASDALRAAADASFGRVTVDGQLSTNDSVFLQATGKSGKPLPDGLLESVLLQLALDLLADGEGATRVARVVVNAAASPPEAERVARAIANSQLVQSAIFGRDPNWGRIVQAAGMALAGEDVDLDASSVAAEDLASEAAEVELSIDLGRGSASTHVWCSDLTYDYVKLNAEYTS